MLSQSQLRWLRCTCGGVVVDADDSYHHHIPVRTYVGGRWPRVSDGHPASTVPHSLFTNGPAVTMSAFDIYRSGTSASESLSIPRPMEAPTSLDAAPKTIVKSFTHRLTGKTYTITLIPRRQTLKQRVAAAIGEIMSECDFMWHAHSFALCQTLRVLRRQPFSAYSFQLHPPPAHVVQGLEFTHHELFGARQRKRNVDGRFVRVAGAASICSVTAATLACTGGSGMLSLLVFALVTGKNTPETVRTHRTNLYQQRCKRDCGALLSRR